MLDQHSNPAIADLKAQARKLRVSILEMLTEAKSGHPGGSLSCVEIVTALFFSQMRLDPRRPDWAERDRFVISKGHGVPTVYAAMAHLGFFPLAELMTLRKTGSRLQGHPDRERLSGIEASTGSLGQGLSVAQGMALAARLAQKPWHTYCLLGDGETQEGQVWEAAMSAPKFKLGGLTVILDQNGGQIDGPVADVMNLEPLADKWRAFNWNVSVVNGHSFDELLPALERSRRADFFKDKPHMIIAKTIKGKGISFMEGKIDWHGVAPTKEQLKSALEELSKC